MLSVIVPVYNGERYIAKAIESALNQTVKPDEIIVVDDASTDQTPEIVKTFKEVIYIRNEKNMERAYSRNLGASIAKGKYLFFLDHDDLWKKEYIEESLEELEKGYDLVYSFPREVIDSEGKVIRLSKKPIPKTLEEVIFNGLIGYPSATGVKRESFLGYDDRYLMREDWEFFIRSYLYGLRIKVIDNRKVLIREHSQRTSKKISLMHATLRVYEDYKDKVPELYLPDFTLHTALLSLRFGKLFTGWKLATKAIAKKPSLLKNPRNTLYLLKWGLRVDRSLLLKERV